MAIESSKITFTGAQGQTLAARLDSPGEGARAFAYWTGYEIDSKHVTLQAGRHSSGPGSYLYWREE